ncbi:hypothetical protein B0H17DRAFT_1144829 [Mycena rosella]|uniref:Uncharacterized protein n=1 Tax=Mycena rosella TaxID=1033263 RepID=A0AAD7G2H9_MYCRO|nr:hypothetical protein B0H17DRAFT_1144829 [Mycena rosella]
MSRDIDTEVVHHNPLRMAPLHFPPSPRGRVAIDRMGTHHRAFSHSPQLTYLGGLDTNMVPRHNHSNLGFVGGPSCSYDGPIGHFIPYESATAMEDYLDASLMDRKYWSQVQSELCQQGKRTGNTGLRSKASCAKREVKSTDYQGCHKKLSWDVAQAREQYVQRRWKSKIGDLRRPSQAGHKPSRAQMIWAVLKIAALLLDNQDNPTRYIAPGRSNGRGSIAGRRQLQMWIFRWLARSQPALWKQRTLLQSKFHVHEHRRANMEIPKPLKRVTANWATGTVDANLDEMAAQCPQLVDSVRIQSGSPLDDCVSTIKEITKSKLASSVSVCVHRQWSGTWPPARRNSPDTCRWRLASAWKKLHVDMRRVASVRLGNPGMKGCNITKLNIDE